MKKITSILMLFLMCFGMAVQAVGVMPELTTDPAKPKWYLVKSFRSGKYLGSVDGATVKQVENITAGAMWYFVQHENGVLMYNGLGESKCYNSANTLDANGTTMFFVKHGLNDAGIAISRKAVIDDHVCIDANNNNDGLGWYRPYSNDNAGTSWYFVSCNKEIAAALESLDYKFIGGVLPTEELRSGFSNAMESCANGNHQGFLDFLTLKSSVKKLMPEAGKKYIIQNAYPEYHNLQGVYKAVYDNGTAPMWGTIDRNADKFYWEFAVKGNGYTLKNVATQQYVKSFKGEGCLTTDESQAAVFTLAELGGLQYNIKIGDDAMHTEWHGNGAGVGNTLTSWPSGKDGASAWYIYEYDFNPAVEVSYNYLLEGKNVLTKTKEQLINETFVLPYINDFFTASIETAGVVSPKNNKVDIVCQEVGVPFTSSVDVQHPALFAVNIHQGRFWNAEGTTEVKATQGGNFFENVAKPAYQWFFVGNAVAGYKIYNVAQGSTKALSNTPDKASFVDAETAPVWNLANSTISADKNVKYFCFTVDGNNYINHQQGVLKYWSSKDHGSSCLFYDVELNLSNNALETANLLKNIPSGAVGNYEYFNDMVNVDKFKSAISKLEADKYDDVARESLKNMLETAKATAVVAFDESKFYRIKNYIRMSNANGYNSNWDREGKGGYIGTTPYANNKTELTCGTDQLNDAGTVWQLVKNGEEGYYLKNLNNGKYIGHDGNQTDNGGVAMFENTSDAGTYKLEAVGNAQYKLDVNGNKLHVSTGKFMYYDSNDPASRWYLIPATELEVNLNADKDNVTWSSLYLPFDVTLPAELEAFTGKLSGNKLSMTKVTEVPANNGVILKGTQNMYTLNIAPAKALEGENALKGTNVKKEITDKTQFYILGNTEANGVGLYHPNATTLKANKAYVETTVGAQVLKFDFNGEATGVEGVEVETENAKAVYYDLSGRRVANPAHGLYIKNGKKVYVK